MSTYTRAATPRDRCPRGAARGALAARARLCRGHRHLGRLPRGGGVVGAAPGAAASSRTRRPSCRRAGRRDRALRRQHAGALGALAPAAARRRRAPGARRLLLADLGRLRGQQRAAGARGRRRARGADGAACGRVEAHRARHDRGRAAARRRRDPRALPRRRLRDPRRGRRRLGRVDRAGDGGGARRRGAVAIVLVRRNQRIHDFVAPMLSSTARLVSAPRRAAGRP